MLADVVVVVADGDGEDLFCLILADDKAIEVVADLFGLEPKVADLLEGGVSSGVVR